jgi:hypothetical protein
MGGTIRKSPLGLPVEGGVPAETSLMNEARTTQNQPRSNKITVVIARSKAILRLAGQSPPVLVAWN